MEMQRVVERFYVYQGRDGLIIVPISADTVKRFRYNSCLKMAASFTATIEANIFFRQGTLSADDAIGAYIQYAFEHLPGAFIDV